jgi:NADH:ubiquinone oxidoreductase subunit F (NADH-binding)
MEFESIGKAGSRLGTALAMAVDHEIGMVRWCATWKSSLPASPAAGVRRAVTVCRGA